MVNVSRQIMLLCFYHSFCFSQPASAGPFLQTEVNVPDKPFSPFIFDQFHVDVRPVLGKAMIYSFVRPLVTKNRFCLRTCIINKVMNWGTA